MLLDELTWDTVSDLNHWAWNVGGTHINIVHRIHKNTYTIFTNRHGEDPYWDLDPWTAQAVLYHLLKE